MTERAPKSEDDQSHAPGTHWLAEYGDADREALVDPDRVLSVFRSALVTAGFTILGAQSHRFDGGGFTGLFLLSESHASIHTWPERRYAAVDLFTCGALSGESVFAVLERALGAGRCELKAVKRSL